MESQTKTSVKDFFLNLGSIVALYTIVISLINLLFTVINKAYPQINTYYVSQSVSWPVAILIIFFPIFVLLMWLLERSYLAKPEKRRLAVKKWLTYITLFFAGLAMAIDLVTVLYYFIDGQELTVGFLLKVLSVFVVAILVFMYYISEIREKLTKNSRRIWLVVAVVIILASVVWGFSVLGSPRTQRLFKYDQQKVSTLQEISYQVSNYYQTTGSLPGSLADLLTINSYYQIPIDNQTGASYEYILIGQSAKAYQLCAVFNKKSENAVNSFDMWVHPEGRHCFNQTIPLDQYLKSAPVR